MAVSYGSVDDNPATSLVVTIPAWGAILVDGTLERETPDAPGIRTVALGPLVIRASTFRAGNFVGVSSFRLVGGSGGWKNEVPEKPYQNRFGISLRMVVSDAAREVGETVEVQPGAERKVGFFYARAEGPAERVLGAFVPRSWWVRPDGVTEVGERAQTPVTSRYDTVSQGTQPAAGRYVVATDDPQDWVPGRTFSSPYFTGTKRISAVVHRLDRSKLRTEVWTE